MVQDGDYIRVIDRQSLSNVEGSILNVWYFEVLSVTGSPVINNMGAEFLTWWEDWMLSTLAPIQTVSTFHLGLTVDNLSAYETEFVITDYETPVTGTVADNFASPTTSWSYQLVRLFRTTRNGSKRFPGVPDSYVSDNVLVGAGVAAIAAHTANLKDVPIVNDGDTPSITLRMVIPKTPVPPATIPTVFNPVNDIIFRGIGSQNSRKQLL